MPHVHTHHTCKPPTCPHTPSPHSSPRPTAQFGLACVCKLHGDMDTWHTPVGTPRPHVSTLLYIPHEHQPPTRLLPPGLSQHGVGEVLWHAGYPHSSSTHVASTHTATLPWALPWPGKATAHEPGTSMSPQSHGRAARVGVAAMPGGVTPRCSAQQSLVQLCWAPERIWGVPCQEGQAGSGRGTCGQRAIPMGCWGGCRVGVPCTPLGRGAAGRPWPPPALGRGRRQGRWQSWVAGAGQEAGSILTPC